MLTQTNFLTRINDFKAFFVKTRNKTTYDYFSDDSAFNEKFVLNTLYETELLHPQCIFTVRRKPKRGKLL